MSFLAFSSICKIPYFWWTNVCKVSNVINAYLHIGFLYHSKNALQSRSWKKNGKQIPAHFLWWKAKIWNNKEQNHDHNWNHTIIFEALVPHFMTHAHKHGNTSKFLQLEKSYFDIFLSFYSPKYTTEIKMELKLFPMIQFKFNI